MIIQGKSIEYNSLKFHAFKDWKNEKKQVFSRFQINGSSFSSLTSRKSLIAGLVLIA